MKVVFERKSQIMGWKNRAVQLLTKFTGRSCI